MAPATPNQSPLHDEHEMNILQPILFIKNEIHKLKQDAAAHDRRVADLVCRIHQASDPSTAHNQDGQRINLDNLEVCIRELSALQEERSRDSVGWEARCEGLRERLCKQVEETLDALLAPERITVKCMRTGQESVFTGPPDLVLHAQMCHDNAAPPQPVYTPENTTEPLLTSTQTTGTLQHATGESALSRRRPAPDDEANDSGPRKRRQTRTIHIDDLYENKTGDRCRILSLEDAYTHPDDRSAKGKHWILRCDEHDRNFGSHVDSGARKSAEWHLKFRHREYDLELFAKTSVFDCFGYAVQGCTNEAVSQYNQWAKTANGTQSEEEAQEQEQMRDTKKTLKRRVNKKVEERSQPGPYALALTTNAVGPSLIEDPQPGDFYIVMWNASDKNKTRAKSPCAVVMLPMGDFGEIGLPGSFDDTELARTVPRCYRPRTPGQGNPGWTEPYADNGGRVRNRRFPFLCFDHETDLQACSMAWFVAKNVLPFQADGFDTRFSRIVNDARRLVHMAVVTGQSVEGHRIQLKEKEKHDTRAVGREDVDPVSTGTFLRAQTPTSSDEEVSKVTIIVDANPASSRGKAPDASRPMGKGPHGPDPQGSHPTAKKSDEKGRPDGAQRNLSTFPYTTSRLGPDQN